MFMFTITYYNKHDKRLDYICCPTSSSSAAFLYLINLIHLQVAFIVCKIIIIKQSHFDFRRRCLALITIIGHVITCEYQNVSIQCNTFQNNLMQNVRANSGITMFSRMSDVLNNERVGSWTDV